MRFPPEVGKKIAEYLERHSSCLFPLINSSYIKIKNGELRYVDGVKVGIDLEEDLVVKNTLKEIQVTDIMSRYQRKGSPALAFLKMVKGGPTCEYNPLDPMLLLNPNTSVEELELFRRQIDNMELGEDTLLIEVCVDDRKKEYINFQNVIPIQDSPDLNKATYEPEQLERLIFGASLSGIKYQTKEPEELDDI